MNNHPIKISVIVPVYNTGKYLARCLESIARQTYTEFECIVVDDGSTDDSFSISKSFEDRDKRFHIFRKENGGISSARNYGMERAKGEYLYFVDSDDELFEYTLSELLNRMTEGVELVIGGYVRCDEDGGILYTTKERQDIITQAKGALDIVAYPSTYITLGMAWLCLYKKSIVDQHGIWYGELHGTVEDSVFLVTYICASKGNIVLSTKPIYKYYCNQPNSIMNTCYNSFKGNTLNTLDGRIAVLETVKRFGKSPKMIYQETLAVYYTYKDLVTYVRQFNRRDLEPELKQKVHNILPYPIFLFCHVRDLFKQVLKRYVNS